MVGKASPSLGGKDEHLRPLFFCAFPLTPAFFGVPRSPDGTSQRTFAPLARRCLRVPGLLERSCLHGPPAWTASLPSTETGKPKGACRGSSLPTQGRAARVAFPLSAEAVRPGEAGRQLPPAGGEAAGRGDYTSRLPLQALAQRGMPGAVVAAAWWKLITESGVGTSQSSSVSLIAMPALSPRREEEQDGWAGGRWGRRPRGKERVWRWGGGSGRRCEAGCPAGPPPTHTPSATRRGAAAALAPAGMPGSGAGAAGSGRWGSPAGGAAEAGTRGAGSRLTAAVAPALLSAPRFCPRPPASILR